MGERPILFPPMKLGVESPSFFNNIERTPLSAMYRPVQYFPSFLGYIDAHECRCVLRPQPAPRALPTPSSKRQEAPTPSGTSIKSHKLSHKAGWRPNNDSHTSRKIITQSLCVGKRDARFKSQTIKLRVESLPMQEPP